MKVKIFAYDELIELEKKMNSWLNQNPNVKYVKVLQGPAERLIVLIFYEEEPGEGKLNVTFE